ncbi:MAG: nuclear transport factor 2 family protein [Cyanobacteriota bacterium]|nr:nuclear transport factor 2 family protein [Cyanobacteriota bacterium]
MDNFKILQQLRLRISPLRWALALGASVSLAMGGGSAIRAAEPETAPPELKEVLARVETAANGRDLEGVLNYYSPTFTNSDNLDRSEFSEGLTELWERYPNLTYRTELESWERRGDGLVAETMTYVTGTEREEGREIQLEATMRSRQVIQNNQIVRQEIVSERSVLSMGTNPPDVEVNLPESVSPGEKYHFDAIVNEPLGNALLLGGALEEKIERDRYFNISEFELDLLQAGGVFKVGTAPDLAEPRWVSAILIGEEGMTVVTQRLQVE